MSETKAFSFVFVPEIRSEAQAASFVFFSDICVVRGPPVSPFAGAAITQSRFLRHGDAAMPGPIGA
jgi:hypothetical protein